MAPIECTIIVIYVCALCINKLREQLKVVNQGRLPILADILVDNQ